MTRAHLASLLAAVAFIGGFVVAHVVAALGPQIESRIQEWRARRATARAIATGAPRQAWFGRQWKRRMTREHVKQLDARLMADGSQHKPPRAIRRDAQRALGKHLTRQGRELTRDREAPLSDK